MLNSKHHIYSVLVKSPIKSSTTTCQLPYNNLSIAYQVVYNNLSMNEYYIVTGSRFDLPASLR